MNVVIFRFPEKCFVLIPPLINNNDFLLNLKDTQGRNKNDANLYSESILLYTSEYVIVKVLLFFD